IHGPERDALEQGPHVAKMIDRHADLADLAFGQHVVTVVAGLSRQIEGDRQAGLSLGEIFAIERVGVHGRRMAGVSPEDPRFVPHRSPAGIVWTVFCCNATCVAANGSAAGTSACSSLRLSMKTLVAAIV